MSQGSQPSLSKISDLSKDQIIESILYLSVNGYSPFKLTDDEYDLIDPSNFGKNMRYIIQQRGTTFNNGVQQNQIAGNRHMDSLHSTSQEIVVFDKNVNQAINFFIKTKPALRKIKKIIGEIILKPGSSKENVVFDSELDQVIHFFSNTQSFLKKTKEALKQYNPQHGISEEAKLAYDCCTVAVSKMEGIEKAISVNGRSCYDDGHIDRVVTYLEEFIECVAQFDIVFKAIYNEVSRYTYFSI
ncbi:hypothetical protein H4219_005739 [Mycoemilia scoparia]|uniref:Uncharacterized protein n=1 Tax=Mycoemilia scoparia TaxID=417184 RepID=A0A9W8DNV8_9FUNG|nr:hypothetical protein H4219_005739 [Mycoemilia scoparia]